MSLTREERRILTKIKSLISNVLQFIVPDELELAILFGNTETEFSRKISQAAYTHYDLNLHFNPKVRKELSEILTLLRDIYSVRTIPMFEGGRVEIALLRLHSSRLNESQDFMQINLDDIIQARINKIVEAKNERRENLRKRLILEEQRRQAEQQELAVQRQREIENNRRRQREESELRESKMSSHVKLRDRLQRALPHCNASRVAPYKQEEANAGSTGQLLTAENVSGESRSEVGLYRIVTKNSFVSVRINGEIYRYHLMNDVLEIWRELSRSWPNDLIEAVNNNFNRIGIKNTSLALRDGDLFLQINNNFFEELLELGGDGGKPLSICISTIFEEQEKQIERSKQSACSGFRT